MTLAAVQSSVNANAQIRDTTIFSKTPRQDLGEGCLGSLSQGNGRGDLGFKAPR